LPLVPVFPLPPVFVFPGVTVRPVGLVEQAEYSSPTTTRPEPNWKADSSFFRMGEGSLMPDRCPVAHVTGLDSIPAAAATSSSAGSRCYSISVSGATRTECFLSRTFVVKTPALSKEVSLAAMREAGSVAGEGGGGQVSKMGGL